MGVRHPSAAVEDPDAPDNRNALPFDGGASAAPGEGHSFGMKTPSPRTASFRNEMRSKTPLPASLCKIKMKRPAVQN